MSRSILNQIEELIREIVREEIRDRIQADTLDDEVPDTEISRHERRVLRELTDRGYILEIQAAEKLRSNDWDTLVTSTHWDLSSVDLNPWQVYTQDLTQGPGDREEREIDVVATKHVSSPAPQLSRCEIELVVECKKRSRENWAFYIRPFPDNMREVLATQGGHIGAPGAITNFTSAQRLNEDTDFAEISRTLLDSTPDNLRRAINGASHHSPIHLESRAIKGYTLFSREDSLRNACLKVLDASAFKSASKECEMYLNEAFRSVYWRIYPIIVFDAPLWVFVPGEDGVVLNQANWVTYDFLWKNRSYYIDIVSWSALEDYLALLDQELSRLELVNLGT